MVLLRAVMLALVLGLVAGCGSEGGEPGDANDPETTSDVEQMKDETGDVD
jgi:hypothetical protein